MKQLLPIKWLFAVLAVAAFAVSCNKDDEPIEVISGFSYTIDPANFLKVNFTNASSNFSSLSWDFGDGSAVSTESNPSHTYAATGTYVVKLTATAADGSVDVSSQNITVTDPDAELTKLTGATSKTWKLLRVVTEGRWPLEVGPIDHSTVWWAQGRDNDEIAKRPCIMNDEYIFSRNGVYEYKTNGDFWAEGGVFDPANVCQTTDPANLKGPNGEDLSAFGDGVHAFRLNANAGKLTVKGYGAFVGLPKIGTDNEVSVPQDSVTYDIIKLTDSAVDTLIINVNWKFPGSMSDDAYWRMVLVHYDDPSQEPGIPDPKPVASFTSELNGLTVSFTNTSQYASSYSWNFGDGNSSTAANPTHTYAAAGIYDVVLTATNSQGTATATQQITVTSGYMTEADLIGGAWKVRNAALSIFVGSGFGLSDWWSVPANFLDGSSSGTEDWSCITNDEFIFSAGGVYEYKANGDARNDGYMGSPNGCISDAALAASGNGAAFGSAVHSFVFTPGAGSQRPVITLTNGASGAAFIGFYKGYYGGENDNSANPPNGGLSTNRYEVMSYLNDGTTETLTLSVDYSAAHDGSRAWSVVLVR